MKQLNNYTVLEIDVVEIKEDVITGSNGFIGDRVKIETVYNRNGNDA
jgi:hypothetical protein